MLKAGRFSVGGAGFEVETRGRSDTRGRPEEGLLKREWRSHRACPVLSATEKVRTLPAAYTRRTGAPAPLLLAVRDPAVRPEHQSIQGIAAASTVHTQSAKSPFSGTGPLRCLTIAFTGGRSRRHKAVRCNALLGGSFRPEPFPMQSARIQTVESRSSASQSR